MLVPPGDHKPKCKKNILRRTASRSRPATGTQVSRNRSKHVPHERFLGELFAERFALRYRTVVCPILSCVSRLSVCL